MPAISRMMQGMAPRDGGAFFLALAGLNLAIFVYSLRLFK